MKQNVVSTRLPSLDGWRALSILLVISSHCPFSTGFPGEWVPAFRWWFDGKLGVRFFFVISGFLITYLLLQEFKRHGTVSLRKFYIRRALRILPVYGCYLLVMLLLQMFTSWQQPLVAWIGNLTSTTNFLPLLTVVPWDTAHLWSLAIEEQFYLVWPGILVFVLLKGNRQMLFYLLAVPIIIAPVAREIVFRGRTSRR